MTTQIAYFRLPAELLDRLDPVIRRMGFSSRSEYFSACAAVTLHHAGCSAEHLDHGTTDWISSAAAVAEEQSSALFDLIRDIAHSVLAVRGVSTTFEHTGEILRRELYQKTGIWATDEDICRELRAYETVHRREFLMQRSAVLAERHGVSRERETC